MLTDRTRVFALAAAALLSAVGALLVLEIGLRLYGFEFHQYPSVQFGWPDPTAIEERYRADPELLWVTQDYEAKLQEARQQPPFIVFMGDSCTEFGTYPQRTLERLKQRSGSVVYGVSVGTGGWTAVQGARQLDRDVLPLRPRVVSIYFGWNDHWVALGPPDADLARMRAPVWPTRRFRLAQLFEKARLALAARDDASSRVDVRLYEETLEMMARRVARQGGRAILITAPSGHERGREPDYLRSRHLPQLDDLVPLHQRYVEATRRAAQGSGAVLCDAAAVFDDLRSPRRRYFRRDGIHLTAAGDQQMADLLADCVERAGLLPR